MTDKMNLIKQGAEAKIFIDYYFGQPVVIKERFVKSYRHPELDTALTKERMKSETRAIIRCKAAGVITPCIYLVDFDRRRIYMEYFENSITAKNYIIEQENLNNHTNIERLASNLGTVLGKMHSNNIIHGDLTTSNILLVNKLNKNDFSDVTHLDLVVIDFGLSHIDSSAEDKGVDLYVLERALLSTHSSVDKFLPILLESYKKANKSPNEVFIKLEEVRMRGRKRTMVG